MTGMEEERLEGKEEGEELKDDRNGGGKIRKERKRRS